MLLRPRLSADGTCLEPANQPVPGKVELCFVGRQPIDNPGNPAKQADIVSQLTGFFRLTEPEYHQLIVISPHNDHRGAIAVVQTQTRDGTLCSQQTNYSITSVTGKSKLEHPHNRIWTLGYADGIMVDLKKPSAEQQNLIYVIDMRALDCVALFGWDGRFAFGVHLSSQTGFGYHSQPDGFQSILKRLFEFGVDPAASNIWLSPAIGGTVDGCHCYEYSEEAGQEDGTRLKECVRREYPTVDIDDLCHSRNAGEVGGKLDFAWCAIIKRVLTKHHNVPEKNIDTSCNLCTGCHSDAWHSDRADRHDKSPEGLARYQQRVGNHMLMYIRP